MTEPRQVLSGLIPHPSSLILFLILSLILHPSSLSSARSPQPGRIVSETGSNVISGTKSFLNATVEVAPATTASNPVPLNQVQSLISTGATTGGILTNNVNGLIDSNNTTRVAPLETRTNTWNWGAAVVAARSSAWDFVSAVVGARSNAWDAATTSSGTTNLATILATGPNPGNMGGLIQSNGTLDNVTLNNSFITNGAVRVWLQFQDILSGSVLPLQLTNTHFTTFNGASWLTLWDSGNDGAASGLDADLLDGLDSLQLATAAALVTATNANFVAIQTAVSNNFVIKTGGTASNLAVAGAYSGNGTAQVHTTSLYGGLAYKPYATPPLSQNNTWWAFTNIAGAFVPEYSLYVMGMDVLGRRFVLLGNQTPVGNTDTFNAEVDSDWIMHIAFGSVAPLNEDARFTIAGLLNKAPLGLKHYRGAPTEYIVTLETNAAVAVQTQWIIEGNHKWAFGTVDGTNIVGIAPLAFVGAGLNTINGYMGPTNFIMNMYTGLITAPGMNAGTITASGTITALNIPGSGIITNNHNSTINFDTGLTVDSLTVDTSVITAKGGITEFGPFTLSGNLIYPRLVLTASTNFTVLSMVSNTWFVCDTTSGNQSNVFGSSANNAANNLGGLGGIKWFSSTNPAGAVILDGGTTTFQFTDTGTRYLQLNCPFTVGIQLHKIAPNPRASVIGGNVWPQVTAGTVTGAVVRSGDGFTGSATNAVAYYAGGIVTNAASLPEPTGTANVTHTSTNWVLATWYTNNGTCAQVSVGARQTPTAAAAGVELRVTVKGSSVTNIYAPAYIGALAGADRVAMMAAPIGTNDVFAFIDTGSSASTLTNGMYDLVGCGAVGPAGATGPAGSEVLPTTLLSGQTVSQSISLGRSAMYAFTNALTTNQVWSFTSATNGADVSVDVAYASTTTNTIRLLPASGMTLNLYSTTNSLSVSNLPAFFSLDVGQTNRVSFGGGGTVQ